MKTPENSIEPLNDSINIKELYVDINIKDIIDKFEDIVYKINKVIYETEYIMPMSEKNIVLDGYIKLCKKKKTNLKNPRPESDSPGCSLQNPLNISIFRAHFAT